MSAEPTPYVDVNVVLHELLPSVRTILGTQFVGMYLSGSLAAGDFDRDSDVDVVVATEEEISGDLFVSLQTMHDRIALADTWCATQLEGTYISRQALRRFDPMHARHANIDRGAGERLKMMEYDSGWVVHCHTLREHGIAVAGPDPRTLIDPVSPGDLRHAMYGVQQGWATAILADPARIAGRGYQSYVVLSLCRIRYTLLHGTVVSKPVAAEWARESLGARWAPLIERAWVGWRHPQLEASPADVRETLEFIRDAVSEVQGSL